MKKGFPGLLVAVAAVAATASGALFQDAATNLKRGKDVYERYCLSCHQADGTGVPYTYPPIARADWVNGDPELLIRMLLNGISGPFYVNGELYNEEMPAYDYLSDEEIAAVLSYIRQDFGNDADPVSAEEVVAIRQEEASE